MNDEGDDFKHGPIGDSKNNQCNIAVFRPTGFERDTTANIGRTTQIPKMSILNEVILIWICCPPDEHLIDNLLKKPENESFKKFEDTQTLISLCWQDIIWYLSSNDLKKTEDKILEVLTSKHNMRSPWGGLELLRVFFNIDFFFLENRKATNFHIWNSLIRDLCCHWVALAWIVSKQASCNFHFEFQSLFLIRYCYRTGTCD